MSEVFIIVGSYLLLIAVIVGVLAFMLSGFMGPYLKVKSSRGKKVLVKIKSMTGDYYRAGSIDEGLLTFKDKKKENRTVSVSFEDITRGLNIYNVELNDENSSIIRPKTKEVVSGYDAVKISNLIIRALMRPDLADNKAKWTLIICAVVLLGIIILLFMTADIISTLESLGQIAGGTVVPNV